MAFQIEDFKPEVGEAKYADEVAALIKAGEGKQIAIQVPTGDPIVNKESGEPTGQYKEAERHKRYFRESAIAADKSARVVSETHNEEDGSTTLRFTLTEKIVRPRKAADADAEAAE